MLEKPAGKLKSIQSHNLRFAAILIILPGKTDRLPVKRLNPGIAEGHPVRIAAKIADNMLRRLKRLLAKNNPFFRIKTVYKRIKIAWQSK